MGSWELDLLHEWLKLPCYPEKTPEEDWILIDLRRYCEQSLHPALILMGFKPRPAVLYLLKSRVLDSVGVIVVIDDLKVTNCLSWARCCEMHLRLGLASSLCVDGEVCWSAHLHTWKHTQTHTCSVSATNPGQIKSFQWHKSVIVGVFYTFKFGVLGIYTVTTLFSYQAGWVAGSYLAMGPMLVWKGHARVIKRDDLEQVREALALSVEPRLMKKCRSVSPQSIVLSYCPSLYVKWNEYDVAQQGSGNMESELTKRQNNRAVKSGKAHIHYWPDSRSLEAQDKS